MPQISDDNNIINNIKDKINFLTGNFENLININKIPAKEPFDEQVINFLNDLSQELILNPEAKAFSDVITFAFWIRRASVLKLKERFFVNNRENHNRENNFYLGKGVVFHVAPSNVPVNFAFSLVSGLLTGNANVVKVPSKNFEQVKLIIRAINKVLDNSERAANSKGGYADLKNYIFLIKYERDREVNDFLSSLTDMRVIWGGDNTINEIRKSPLAPRAGEITFADRYSAAVIDSDFYMNLDINSKNKVAQDFYNDTFFSDQNACTSPRIVIWTGNKIDAAKKEFWCREHEIVKNKYTFQDIQAVNKLTSFYMLAAHNESVKLAEHSDNLIIRAEVSGIDQDLMKYRDNSGYFLEYNLSPNISPCGIEHDNIKPCGVEELNKFSEIKNLLNDKKCQTVAYIGSPDEIITLVKTGIKGVDRIVPFGKTMDFDLIWDGYNLFSQLTRTVKVEFSSELRNASDCKLIFLDVDGTLTPTGENTPPESALNAIKKSKAAGNKIFLCTGRNPDMLLPLLEYNKIFADSGGLFDGIIASAGGYVSVFTGQVATGADLNLKDKNKVLFNLPMTSEQRDAAIEIMHRNGIFCTIEGVTGTWGDENLDEFLREQPEDNGAIERWRKILSENLKIRPMSEYDGSPVHKLVVMCREEAQLDEARALLEKDFKFVIHDMPSELNYITCELINRKFNKGTGVKLIRDEFKINIENTFGFGDSMNDLEMMNEVGTGVCMGNGAEGLKKCVTQICPALEDDGIAWAFKELKLI